ENVPGTPSFCPSTTGVSYLEWTEIAIDFSSHDILSRGKKQLSSGVIRSLV
ncbi:hypothetical protein BaRGS_00025430, partial [Batillaria attramentaria]